LVEFVEVGHLELFHGVHQHEVAFVQILELDPGLTPSAHAAVEPENQIEVHVVFLPVAFKYGLEVGSSRAELLGYQLVLAQLAEQEVDAHLRLLLVVRVE